VCVCVESCTHKTHFGMRALSHAQIHVHTLSLWHTLSLRLSVCRLDLNPQPKCAPHTHTECKNPTKMAENDLVSGGHGQAGSWREQ